MPDDVSDLAGGSGRVYDDPPHRPAADMSLQAVLDEQRAQLTPQQERELPSRALAWADRVIGIELGTALPLCGFLIASAGHCGQLRCNFES